MAVLTISITNSPLEYVAGIPSNITLSTNIPATIFYSLDGSTPDINSQVAIGFIELPTDVDYVELKVFATNGSDSSPIITQEYKTNIVGSRRPRSTIKNRHGYSGATFPFGSQVGNLAELAEYGNTGGVIVDEQDNPHRHPDGYTVQQTPDINGNYAPGGGAGYFVHSKSKYENLFSETDSIGQTGRGVGTMPGRVLWVKPRNDNTQVESTNASDPHVGKGGKWPTMPLFNPRALVIFQDSSDEPEFSTPLINRSHFDLEDQTKSRDGSMLTINDAITTSGSFVRAHYNPTHNTMTYYYYDNRVGRWIISKEPYNSSQNPTSNLSNMVTARGDGMGKVFKWIPFKYRSLV
jgi:hypothetical protein